MLKNKAIDDKAIEEILKRPHLLDTTADHGAAQLGMSVGEFREARKIAKERHFAEKAAKGNTRAVADLKKSIVAVRTQAARTRARAEALKAKQSPQVARVELEAHLLDLAAEQKIARLKGICSTRDVRKHLAEIGES